MNDIMSYKCRLDNKGNEAKNNLWEFFCIFVYIISNFD